VVLLSLYYYKRALEKKVFMRFVKTTFPGAREGLIPGFFGEAKAKGKSKKFVAIALIVVHYYF
jgi:hypothetical protein